jgi:hypothetical protein
VADLRRGWDRVERYFIPLKKNDTSTKSQVARLTGSSALQHGETECECSFLGAWSVVQSARLDQQSISPLQMAQHASGDLSSWGQWLT